jgi:hypothetical protein
MVRANTPGQRDGRIACWLDGKLIADFPNLRLRDVATLKMDRAGLMLHIKSNTTRVKGPIDPRALWILALVCGAAAFSRRRPSR